MALAAVLDRGDKVDARRHPLSGAVTSICFTEEINRIVQAYKKSQDHVLIREMLDDPRLHFAIGLHPKVVSRLSDEKLQEAIESMRFLIHIFGRRFVGIGEVGLDYTSPEATWDRQRRGLRRILMTLQEYLPGKVVVLHIRSAAGSSAAGRDAAELLRGMTAEGTLDRSQALQLHHFLDDADVVRRWRQVFPNTYFSIPGAVESAREAQMEGLRTIDSDRLLLETDSGATRSMKVVTQRPLSMPSDVHRVAEVVARILFKSPQQVLRSTTRNAERLFLGRE